MTVRATVLLTVTARALRVCGEVVVPPDDELLGTPEGALILFVLTGTEEVFSERVRETPVMGTHKIKKSIEQCITYRFKYKTMLFG